MTEDTYKKFKESNIMQQGKIITECNLIGEITIAFEFNNKVSYAEVFQLLRIDNNIYCEFCNFKGV